MEDPRGYLRFLTLPKGQPRYTLRYVAKENLTGETEKGVPLSIKASKGRRKEEKS